MELLFVVLIVISVFKTELISCLLNSTYCVSENSKCDSNISCVECHSIAWFVNGSSGVSNNSLIYFLPGQHYLSNGSISFSHQDNLQLYGVLNHAQGTPDSLIVCNGNQTGFLFHFSANIEVYGLEFRGCGAVNSSAIHFLNSSNVTMSHVTIINSIGSGLIIDTVCSGFVSISNTIFTSYLFHCCEMYHHIWIKLNSSDCSEEFQVSMNLTLEHSSLTFGPSNLKRNGLYMWIEQPGVHITVNNVTILNSTESNIKLCVITLETWSSKIEIANSLIESGIASHGGGLDMALKRYFGCYSNKTNIDIYGLGITTISLVNTTFKGNSATESGGALHVKHFGTFYAQSEVIIHNCSFINNHAKSGAAAVIRDQKYANFVSRFQPQLCVNLTGCNVSQNVLLPFANQINDNGMINIYDVEKMAIEETVFADNNGTALLLVESAVIFSGNVIFQGNKAFYGAAIKLWDDSVFFLKDGTHLFFENNSAEVAGGAIYVGNQCLKTMPQCFYQPISDDGPDLQWNMSLTFINNSATIAGDSLYGGSVDYCRFFYELSDKDYFHGHLFETIFHISPQTPSDVSSDPYGLCFCNIDSGRPNCSTTKITIPNKYPGETFVLHVAAVGQMNGTVPAMINVSYMSPNAEVKILQYKTTTKATCQELSIAVFTQHEEASSVDFRLIVIETNPARENSNYYHMELLNITVLLEPCPWLFALNKSSKKCDCFNPNFFGFSPSCDINSMSICKDTRNWIECARNSSVDICSRIEFSTRCTFCNESINVFTPTNISSQCIRGRGGRICGGCISNHSISLGPTKCIRNEKCSVGWLLFLILIFFSAGIVLFCFLGLLNLTVSEGSLNGLLFFANCVQINENSFFYHNKIYASQIFRVVISWLNLDLGFQVCFYSGMTAYQKIWLEFGFLLYLLLLGVLIVCLSHRFVWFTRLVGRNVVPVLATVVLLACQKLARNSIKVLTYYDHHFWSSDNYRPLMWRADTTIDYFSGKHIFLSVFTIFISIPGLLYILCLLLIQCLQRRSNWFVLRWVDKLRPFFDANTGPCQTNYQFWPGLLMFVRIGLFISSEIVSATRDKLMLLITACVMVIFLMFVFPGGVYKKWQLNILDFWFFFLLSVMSISLLAYWESQDSKYIFPTLTLGVAIATLLIILLYHVWAKIHGTKMWKKFVICLRNRRRMGEPAVKEHNAEINEEAPLIRPQGMPPVINFNAPREPLLEDD